MLLRRAFGQRQGVAFLQVLDTFAVASQGHQNHQRLQTFDAIQRKERTTRKGRVSLGVTSCYMWWPNSEVFHGWNASRAFKEKGEPFGLQGLQCTRPFNSTSQLNNLRPQRPMNWINNDGHIAVSMWYNVIWCDPCKRSSHLCILGNNKSALKDSRLQLSSQAFVQGAQCFTKGRAYGLHGSDQGSIADFAGRFVKNQREQELAIHSLRSVAFSRWIVWNCSFKGSADKQEDAIGLTLVHLCPVGANIDPNIFDCDQIGSYPKHQQRRLQQKIVWFRQRSNMVKRFTLFSAAQARASPVSAQPNFAASCAKASLFPFPRRVNATPSLKSLTFICTLLLQ